MAEKGRQPVKSILERKLPSREADAKFPGKPWDPD